MDPEQFITKILNSTNGMSQATPDAKLFGKIQQRIFIQQQFSKRQILLIAASFVVLVAVNLSVFKSKSASENKTTAIAFSISKSNQLY
ncbi:MAG TPA: hypothetical protein VK528_07425 [Flavobacterium sp.]|nr:hypothetical protein [Flavobacterium sp.]